MMEQRSLLKQDVRGRVQTPTARREELLDEFERGGLSGGKFAALVGVKYSTFASWVAKRKRARAGKSGAKNTTSVGALRLVEAMLPAGCEVHATSRAEALSVHLVGGMRLEITHESQARLAAALLKALEAARSC
jgi:hypothetical protein